MNTSSPFLMDIIAKFAASRHSGSSGEGSFYREGLDTPLGAYCMCDTTSSAFIRFAKAAGYMGRLDRYDFDIATERNPDPTLYARGRHDACEYNKASWHSIVETEHFLLDFTAKQYHSNASYPHIISHAVAGIPKFNGDFAAAAAAGGD